MSKFVVTLAKSAARVLPTPLKNLLYKIGPVSRVIRRSLNQSLPSGTVDTEIVGGDLRGMKMALNLQEEKSYWLGTYETDLVAELHKHVLSGGVVYDVGANIGYMTLVLAKLVGRSGRVFSFEVLPGNLERLRRNVQLNGLEDVVSIEAKAVADVSREMQFLISPYGAMGKLSGSGGYSEGFTGTIDVSAISLDEFVFSECNPPPALVKMDIEGGEVLALPGMRRVLRENRPVILIELHGHDSARAAWDALTAEQYELATLSDPQKSINSWETLDWRSFLIATPARNT